MDEKNQVITGGVGRYLILFTVFFCGMAVMIIELVGSRVVAPYVGTSVYVWTSLIGVILGSLSLGYHYGGKLADQNPSLKNLALILFLAGIFTSLIIYFRFIAFALGIFSKELSITSVIVAPFLFVPATFFFGMITPYITRLYLKNLETSGSAVGNLYALSTIGSILGTFLGGFFLISYFGNSKILMVLGILTITLSFLVHLLHRKSKAFFVIALLGIFISSFSLNIPSAIPLNGDLLYDSDTPYKRVWVYDKIDEETNKPARILTDTIFGSQSGIFLDGSTEPLFSYQKYFDLADHFKPDAKNTLMIGAGAFTFSTRYLKEKPENIMEVVEIDPELKEISEKYFDLIPNSRLSIVHEDGRTFLNNTKKIYDVIYVDAFSSFLNIPHQLTTKEATQNFYNKLAHDGVVITNLISGISGFRGEFLRAQYATYKSVFPTVLLFKINEKIEDDQSQNLILVALKSTKPNLVSKNKELNSLLKKVYTKEIATDMPVLLDDYAPVERYIAKILL